MKPSFSLFWIYTKKIFKRWVFWLFLALDFIAVIAQFVFPSLRLPQFVYILIAVIGLIWAGFEAYLELLEKIPSESRPLTPEIYIFLEEGNEYSYELISEYQSKSGEKKTKYQKSKGKVVQGPSKLPTLPSSLITQHIRLENKGLVNVNILSVEGRFKFHDDIMGLTLPYLFYIPDLFDSNGIKASYPIVLRSKDTLVFNVASLIGPSSQYTDAQISARTRNILENEDILDASISVEAIDPKGKIYKYHITHKISLTPLCNMYIAYWNQLGRSDLANIATGETTIVD
ncbi:MAG: hypothetical protein FD146_1870 [Anaerolineaceae bacterium]|nr:MAG: hypothetical protein FD146_1870 [Anaerolineaceae bacterium]